MIASLPPFLPFSISFIPGFCGTRPSVIINGTTYEMVPLHSGYETDYEYRFAIDGIDYLIVDDDNQSSVGVYTTNQPTPPNYPQWSTDDTIEDDEEPVFIATITA
jgi:hypothetical protein